MTLTVPSSAGVEKPSPPRRPDHARRPASSYLWLVPAFALLAFVVGYPIVENVVTSVTRPYRGSVTFVGLDRYTALLADPTFYRAVLLTIIWTAGVTALQFGLGLAAALAADRSTWFVRRVRPVLIVPWVLPGVVAANVWVVFYTDNGLVNDLLGLVGIDSDRAWLADGRTALVAVIVAAAWKGFPFYFLMMLAGLQSVPQETREAATIDGAGSFQTLTRVVLPQMRAVIVTSLALGVIATSNYFDGIYLMTGGGPSGATLTLPVWVYNTAFSDFDIAKASALSVVILLIVLVPVIVRLVARRGAVSR